MIAKKISKTGRSCRVTFRVPADAVEAGEVSVVGEFNDWDPGADPLVRRKNGAWSATVSIPTGRSYRFRYLADGGHWITDPDADRHVPNRFGSFDGVLDL